MLEISDKVKGRIRMGLWIAGMFWAAYFFIYALIMMPALMDVLYWLWPEGGFNLWATLVFYALCVLTVVIIFFWFFYRLWKKK